MVMASKPDTPSTSASTLRVAAGSVSQQDLESHISEFFLQYAMLSLILQQSLDVLFGFHFSSQSHGLSNEVHQRDPHLFLRICMVLAGLESFAPLQTWAAIPRREFTVTLISNETHSIVDALVRLTRTEVRVSIGLRLRDDARSLEVPNWLYFPLDLSPPPPNRPETKSPTTLDDDDDSKITLGPSLRGTSHRVTTEASQPPQGSSGFSQLSQPSQFSNVYDFSSESSQFTEASQPFSQSTLDRLPTLWDGSPMPAPLARPPPLDPKTLLSAQSSIALLAPSEVESTAIGNSVHFLPRSDTLPTILRFERGEVGLHGHTTLGVSDKNLVEDGFASPGQSNVL